MYGLTPREEQIMNTIWNMDHPCLISEILKASPALKRNTVAPALVVLENKGYLVFYVFRKIKIGPPDQLLICNVRTKNVPRHILASAAVACSIYLIHRSAHPRGAFFALQEHNFL